MKETEVLWQDAGHVFARWRDVLVQIRGDAELTPSALDSIATASRLVRAQIPAPRLIGALLVIEGRAPPPQGPAIAAQRALFQDIFEDPRVHTSLVLEGDGTDTALKRAVARGRFKNPRLKMFSTVADGARYIVDGIGLPARFDELVGYVESIRPP
jgi:hypothetical protein